MRKRWSPCFDPLFTQNSGQAVIISPIMHTNLVTLSDGLVLDTALAYIMISHWYPSPPLPSLWAILFHPTTQRRRKCWNLFVLYRERWTLLKMCLLERSQIYWWRRESKGMDSVTFVSRIQGLHILHGVGRKCLFYVLSPKIVFKTKISFQWKPKFYAIFAKLFPSHA